jgi:signal transduction histidine kinase
MGETIQPMLTKDHVYQASVRGDFAGVWLDEKLLNHILTNLLGNAVKYSPRGGTVRFDTWIEGSEVVLQVEDEGIGITAEDRERLYESLHRGKNVGDIPGTGLGLAVVKRAVDAHQGRLDVQSGEGEGTCFTVHLPLERRSRASGPRSEPPRGAPDEARDTADA